MFSLVFFVAIAAAADRVAVAVGFDGIAAARTQNIDACLAETHAALALHGTERRSRRPLPLPKQKLGEKKGSLVVVYAACGASHAEEAVVMLHSLRSRTSLELEVYAFTNESVPPEVHRVDMVPSRYDGNYPCSSQTLLGMRELPRHVTSALVVDTDVLFQVDVANLVDEAKTINAFAVGVSEHGDCFNSSGAYYPNYSSLDYVGHAGMNTGVVYWNDVGPMRTEAWLKHLDSVVEKFGGIRNFPLGDQDLLNAALSTGNYINGSADSLSCEYNYRPDYVVFDAQECDRCPGLAKVIHANRRAFHPESIYYDKRFGDLYQAEILSLRNAGSS